MSEPSRPEQKALDRERDEILQQLESWLETPLLILGLAWLVLLVVELVWGLSPWLEPAVTVIWVIFAVDFALRFLLAPHKLAYLRGNWLTALALFVPALRVLRITRAFRVLRLARTVRGFQLVRIVSSVNRGMRSLQAAMRRRGLGYVIALSVMVILAGAAGMLALEPGLPDYGEAVWWAAMMLTTLGSDYWPQTAEGRILAFMLALYAFGVFGYVTASLASFLIGRDRGRVDDESMQLGALQREISALRAEIRELRQVAVSSETGPPEESPPGTP